MPYFTSQDYKIFYSYSNADPDSQKPAILLIHGAAGVHLHWAEELRKHPKYQVIAIDLPGHGRSRLQQGQAPVDSIPLFAALLKELISHLQLQRVILMGHSMGGMIAQQLALELPEKVQKLVLLSSSANLQVNPRILEEAGIPEKLPGVLDLMNEMNYAQCSPQDMKDRARKILARVPAELILADFTACKKFDVTSPEDFDAPKKMAHFLDKNLLITPLMKFPERLIWNMYSCFQMLFLPDIQ